MTKPPKSQAREKVASTVTPLAEKLLLGMATRESSNRPIETRHVARLRKAALSCSKTGCLSACERIASQGISYDDVVDRYIPAVARTLGEEWAEDRITFASTAVGTAMLQWLLGALEQTDQQRDIPANGAGILLLVPADEHHTLGAVLLGNQLRRRGYWVKLMLQARAESLEAPLQHRRFDATMISASAGTRLRELRNLVATSRHVTANRAPVLIGGTIVDAQPDLIALSGADHAATDLEDALRLCAMEPASGVASY